MTKNLLSINDLPKQEMLDLIEFARNFKSDDGSFRKEVLFPDKTIANIFCEPSTRTKSSFEIAAKNLGCSVIDFDIASSSIEKGESIYETVDALGLMGVDLCVLRHPDSVIRELAEYTSSFIEVLSNFSFGSLTFCGHPSMCTKYLDPALGKYEPDLDLAIQDADVIMTLRIQYERFEEDLNLDLEDYKQAYELTSERVGHARGDVIVMHPGPLNYIEISESVYQSENSVIRDQIANGVAIRMAVLSRFLSS